MIVKNRAKDPKQIMMMGMAFLLAANLWPRYVHVTGGLGPDAVDGAHGVLMGLAIGLLCWSAWLGGRLRRGERG
jgi:hypothetical protein